jgi:hypothetical protein
MPGLHSYLSPSGAKRWLTCTLSPQLEKKFQETESVYAAEGTLWHSLNELLVKRKLRRVHDEEYKRELKAIQSHELYSDEMLEHSEEFSVFIIEKFYNTIATTPDAQLFTETVLDLSKYVPECFGTGDINIVADKRMIFVDGKYGQGVPVFADHNEQCMLYSLGALEKYGWMYHIEEVEIIIYQPRIKNTNSWVVNVKDLYAWAEGYLKPRALMAYQGRGEYVAGDHCKFCKAKATCRANAEYYMSLAEEVFREPDILTDAEVANVLTKIRGLKNWAESIEEHAVAEAKKGRQWPGFKLVAGIARRKYKDAEEVVKVLTAAGFMADTILKPREVKGLGAMKEALGSEDFAHYLNDHIILPYGKPTLVDETDKRPAYDRSKEAADIFNDGKD